MADELGTMTDTIPALVERMTLEEKADLLTGKGMWRTHGVEGLGVRGLVMTDGTYGVRYSISQIDEQQAAGIDLDAFLETVNRKANDVEIAFGSMKPATCFPNGSSMACSWDLDLAYAMGEALGRECRSLGVDVLLGPGVNIRRTPLGGRAYEYFSEDPVVTGDFAAAMINGLQSQGVGASLKHFACNNSEMERTSMDSIVDERALREIYLLGYERAIAKSDPWTVMSSYNRLNGEQAAESHWLLTQVLRDEWGYRGLVMSDWHGIKDRPASLAAGNDLDMPESQTRRDELLAAVRSGKLALDVVDTACARMIALVRRADAGRTIAVEPADHAQHHALARKLAGESIVLLKNEGGVLPLSPTQPGVIAVIGESAKDAVIQGSGCATTSPTRVDQPFDAIRDAVPGADLRYFPGSGHPDAVAEAVAGAKDADVAVLFVNSEVGWDGEGSDRRSMNLAQGQDALIAAVAAVNPRTVVVISSPDAVVMPWIDQVPAVLGTFFSGQAMGSAVADILFGAVNPSGKLTTSFPLTMKDIPGYLSYPGENGRHVYAEGLFVGYRSYDSREAPVLFPFGHGLGYAAFDYANLTLDCSDIREGESLTVSFDLTNRGAVAGKEISQLYVRYGSPRFSRPVHELKGFVKTPLEPGETRRVTLTIPAEDLRYWNPARGCWVLDEDEIVVEVAASSRDIRLEATLSTRSRVGRYCEITFDTQPSIILATPIAHQAFRAFIAQRLSVSESDAEHILQHCASSFLGMTTTLDRRLRQRVTRAEVQPLLDRINAEIRAWEQQG